MARIIAISAALILGFGFVSISVAKQAPESSPTTSINLPHRIQSACTRATGDLLYVCGEYTRLYRETEVKKVEQAQKLQHLTFGGLADSLR
jgi:hypothetical protein